MRNYHISGTRDHRKVRIEIVIATIVAITLILGFLWVNLDILRTEPTIDNSQNSAIYDRVEDEKDSWEYNNFDEFVIRTPSQFKYVGEVNNILDEGEKYKSYTFEGTEGDYAGRKLEVFVNDIPATYPVTKVLYATSSRNKIAPIRISDQCISFTDVPDEFKGQAYPSKWNNTSFTCLNTSQSNIVAAIDQDQADGVEVKGYKYTNNYLFIYTDHGRSENNALFNDILMTFEAK